MTPPVRVRFAPSPTGYLHVGGARTALFNYLFARCNGGAFILRIEDTDRSRFQEGALEEIYSSLEWLGLDWDEGPGRGGGHGPYVQSSRTDLYRRAAETLLTEGKAYRCFCTPERLAQVRLEREKAKMPSGYDRHCRALSSQRQRELLEASTPFTIRLKVPSGGKVVFIDLIRGPIEYSTDVLDDPVLLKSDGFPTYHLANVVDDHSMEISHVLRGDEWIASTPRHVLLYEALGWPPPLFAHMPVILSPDGGKLSKRKGAASVMDYKRAGFLPEALFNFLAFLGWSPGEGDQREIMTREELIAAFSLEHISPKAAVFDEKKLEWMNGRYLEQRSAQSLVDDVAALLKEKGLTGGLAGADASYLESVIALLKGRWKRVAEIVENGAYFFKDPVDYEEKAAKNYFTTETADLLEKIMDVLAGLAVFKREDIEQVYKKITETGVSFGSIVHPTRLAISGVSSGPGLFEVMEVLGKETVMRRLKRAVEMMNKK